MLKAITLSLTVALGAAAVSAETTTVNGTFDANTSTQTYQDTDSFSRGFYVPQNARTPITGLQKFDPSFGILTGVAVSIDFDYSYDIHVQAGPVTDPQADHAVTVTHQDRILFPLIRPQVGVANTLLAAQGPALGTYLASGSGDTSTSSLTQGNGQVNTSLLDITSHVDLADFIGNDEVDVLQVALYLPYSLEQTLDNVASASTTITSSHSAGTISLQYTYIIPEPASMALLSLGSLLLLRRRVA